MRPLVRSFRIFLRQIWGDSMLAAVVIAPVLIGVFFRFGIPAAEDWLCARSGRQTVLAEYYLLFDLFLNLMTPYMFCFASAVVMLTERDENLASYLAVTPVGKSGYVASRLLVPAGISCFASAAITVWFGLTPWRAGPLALLCLLTSLSSVIIALLIVTAARNRVEGMAMGKLSGVMLAGLAVPFFVTFRVQYCFGVLPSFWIAKIYQARDILFAMPALACALLWLWVLSRRFAKKLI